MYLRRLTLLFVLLIAAVTPATAQQTAIATIAISAYYGGTAKTGTWLPVRITATNDGPDRDAIVRVGTTGGSFDTPIELPRGARKSLTVYVRPQGFVRSLKAHLVAGETMLATADLDLTPLPVSAQIIGLIMEQPLTAPLPVPRSAQIRQATPALSATDLPNRVEGLAMFDALLVDHSAFQGLQPEQVTALDDWIQSGGQVVMAVGQDPAAIAAQPALFQIATAQASTEQTVVGTALAELGTTTLRAARLTPSEGATAVDPLVVQRQWGRGRITLVGWNFGDLQLQNLPPATTLWSSLMHLQGGDPAFQSDQSTDDLQEQQFAQALYNLPVLTLPPLNVLAALLVVYILLVGPGLFVVLRRLDRQALAWVLIPAITLLFSAGAYGYGLRIRGNDVILNEISFIQVLGDRARVRTFAGIFSPATRSYDVEVAGDALTRPLQFDPSMWGGQRTDAASPGRFLQHPGAIRDLAVGQWSMTTFAAETRMELPTITARLELGERVLSGAVRNDGAATVRHTAIIYGSKALLIGDLAPGATQQVEFPITAVGGMGASLSMTIFEGRWNTQTGPSPDIRIPAQLIDSLYSFSPVARPASPIVIGWIDDVPLRFTADANRMQIQRLGLVEVPIDLDYGPSVAFPRGLLWPEYESGGANNSCMSPSGPGIIVESDNITATVRLPATARNLTISKATLYTQLEGPPPDRIVSDVFDWQENAWKPQSEKLGGFELSNPQRFFRNGELRVRMQLPPNASRGGCLIVDSSIEGKR